MRLANQVAIVTGAGRGLGEQVARAFCREGAKVVLASEVAFEVESVSADLKAQGFPALGICADVRDEQSIRALFQRTREAFDEVDILVNCAGVMLVKPVRDMDPEEWDNLIRINLRGPYLCCREALSGMIPRRRGVILNVTSNLGSAGFQLVTAYCASKFGLEGFTQALALEVKPHGIRVNAIRPGGVARTAMGIDSMKKLDGVLEIPDEEWDAADTLCEPAVFLASDEGAEITGQSIDSKEWRAERSRGPRAPGSA